MLYLLKYFEDKYLKAKKYCKVRDHCHCAGECSCAANSVYNFKIYVVYSF